MSGQNPTPPCELGNCRFCEEEDGVGAPHYVGDKILAERLCRACKKGILGVFS